MRENRLAGFIMLGLMIWTIGTAAPLHADAREADFDIEGHSTILFDRNNGLPTSEANAIAQTEDGFIWIGSYSGLIRYDGNHFSRITQEVRIASVMSLYVDSKDRLWVGTNDSGAALYEDGIFSLYGREDGLKSLSVRSIAEDGDGNVFLGTTKGLAYVDSDDQLHEFPDERLEGESIRNLVCDGENNIYGVTSNSLCFMIEDLQITHFVNAKDYDMEVSCICPVEGKKGTVRLGTWGSDIMEQDLIAGWSGVPKTYSALPLSNANKIYQKDGMWWVCADDGIGYFDENGSFSVLKDMPLNNSVGGMMKDYEGNLWFVSSRQGIMEITSSPFTDISRNAGLDSMVVNSTCMFGQELYIGTDKGLVVLDAKMHSVQNALTEELAGIRIRCIKKDSQGKLWLCCYNDRGLVCYDGNEAVTYNTDNGLVSNWVRAMTELSDGRIAVACSGGMSLIENGRVVRSYSHADGLENTEILTVCDGGGGKIYLGSDGDGIYVVDGDDVSHYGLEDGLKSEIILRIKQDPEKDLYWIITSNSISYLENGEIRTVTNFPYSNNFDMYFNKYGEAWVLSSNGIYSMDRNRLFTDEELEYSFYDFQCGLPYVSTANSRSHLSEDGTLYISGAAGVCSIDIDGQGEEQRNIKLCVPFVEMDDRQVRVKDGETVVVPADCKRLTIYGYALTFSLHNPHLVYRLKGFDDKSVMTTGNEIRPISYTNLDGGDYLFELSVVDSRTGEVKDSLSIKIRKEKALHEYMLFWVLLYAGVILIIVAAALLYTKLKTRSLMKKHEKNRAIINQLTSAFAKSIDLKDKYTNGHSFRVAQYSKMLAGRLGYSEEELEEIYNIALLHDIGKITIPVDILSKPGKLTDEEYEIIKQHAENGYNILKEIEIVPDLALGAGFHHERIDGKGYPSGRTGDEIPKVAQIIAVADTFDAMNSTRPYRRQMPMDEIVAELKRVAGTQLNTEIVKVLLDLIREGAFLSDDKLTP